MKKTIVIMFLLCFAYSTFARAAEVKQLKVGQSGDKAVATYDLVCVEGEQEAEVTVVITIDGVRRTSEDLKLTGDFGPGVKVGTRKKIIWDATADLPSDFDGELSWDVQAVSVSATSLPEEQKPVIKAKDVIEMKKGVTFYHKAHITNVGSCKKCHEKRVGKIEGFGRVFAHKLCKGCHADMRRGPTSCKDCHQ